MIKGVIFDMDGVLVDNRDVHIEAFMIFCRRYSLHLSRQKLMGMFGMGNDEIIPLLLPADLVASKGIEALANEKEQIYRDIFADTICPVKGLTELLADLQSAGIKCAVGSSGQSANVNYVLEKCGIADNFDAIANGDLVTRCKPDPEVFLLAANLLELEPKDCLVFEDSFAGIKAARSASMKVIAMATTFSREELDNGSDNDLIISDFTEISASEISAMA